MFLVNVLTCRLKDTRGMSPEVQLRRVMSFMDDFTPAQSEALSLHSVTSSTVFSFPPESNVYCVISAAHFLTGSHVASLRLNCGWLIEQIILLCVFGIKGCFRHSQSFLGSGKLRLQEKVRPKYGSAVNSGANPSRLGLIHRRKPLWANHMLDFFFFFFFSLWMQSWKKCGWLRDYRPFFVAAADLISNSGVEMWAGNWRNQQPPFISTHH